MTNPRCSTISRFALSSLLTLLSLAACKADGNDGGDDDDADVDAAQPGGREDASPPSRSDGAPDDTGPTPDASPPGDDPILVGAADIASCSSSGDEKTADLLDEIPGTIFIAGDVAYESGTTSEFMNCFDPSWGRHKDRIRPAPGNHEYKQNGAAPYFDYFGAAAGDPSKGYYSYDLGAWHIIAINSNCGAIGGCGAGSAQEQWLRADLKANSTKCTLAYFHHPRFSSGGHGNTSGMQPFWQALYDYDADVVISAHDHNYERFAPQDPMGNADPESGIRQFLAGTGGKSHDDFPNVQPNSEVREGQTFGVLKMTLRPTGYDWEFVPVAGETFTDSGSDVCH